VSLTVTDDDGLSDTDTATCTISSGSTKYSNSPSNSQITSNKEPIAMMNAPNTGIINTIINFNSEGSYDPDGTIVSYHWDFGDGETSSESNPNHSYSASGNYTITLEVQDNNSEIDKVSSTINIIQENQPPISIIDGPREGKENISISFSSDKSYDPDGEIVEYLWDFGNEITRIEKNPLQIFNRIGEYYISLTVTDDDGSKSTSYTTCIIKENQPPITRINSPSQGEIETEIFFSSQGSLDPDGEVIGYSWDFGDGSPRSQLSDTSHIYKETGEYVISLTITDDNQESSTERASFRAFFNEEPVPQISSPTTGYINESIHFTSNKSYDPDGEIIRFIWDFGDGFVAYMPNLFHEYSETGTYKVSLTVIDDLDKTTTTFSTITILEKTMVTKFPVFTALIISVIALAYYFHKRIQPIV
jgi:PKD repeat protein